MCQFQELKGDRPVNTTTNLTLGYNEVKGSVVNVIIPKNYFCFARIVNEDQNRYFGFKV